MIVVTGGGTGGHVFPALALADALVARGVPRSEVRFVGAVRGLEARAVPAAGYEIALLPLDGLQRSLAPREVLRSIRALLAFVAALFACRRHLRSWRPAVVVGVGGYASAPCVLAARLVRVPTVVHEQNAVPGLVNRLAVRLGAQPAVSLPTPSWPHAVVTGNPVRDEIEGTRWVPDLTRPLLAVVGGSLGAGRLNDVALGLYERWRARDDLRVHHVTGRRQVDACRERLRRLHDPADRLDYELVAFEDDMAGLYSRSALMLCRAGATTVAELAAVGVPAVLVPWSGAAQDQQRANAEALAATGGAEVLLDAECDTERVRAVAEALLADRGRLERMSAAARGLAPPGAARRLADHVLEVAGARA